MRIPPYSYPRYYPGPWTNYGLYNRYPSDKHPLPVNKPKPPPRSEYDYRYPPRNPPYFIREYNKRPHIRESPCKQH